MRLLGKIRPYVGHKNPPYSYTHFAKFSWGKVSIKVLVRNKIIKDFYIYGDFFAQRESAALEALLVGVRHKEASLRAALAETPWEAFFAGCDAQTMADFFCRL